MMRQRHNTTERSSKTLINYTRRRAHALPSQRRLNNEIRTTYKWNGDRQQRSTLDVHKKKNHPTDACDAQRSQHAAHPCAPSRLVRETNQHSTMRTDTYCHSFIIRHSLRNSIIEGE